MEKIELEYRAEININEYDNIREQLQKSGTISSTTKRLSYMGFSNQKEHSLDIRVRITNGKSEVVLKKGGWDSSNRIEIPQEIDKSQFMGFVRIFGNIVEKSYISERQTINFKSRDNIVISLVKSRSFAYIEFEILSDRENEKQNDELLKKFISENGFIIMTKEGFDDLCERLKVDDWKFDSTNQEDIKRLEESLSQY